MSCSNQKCIEPCRGSCGLRAECKVHNHNPMCYCPNGYTGDPFTQCEVVQSNKVFWVLFIILLFLYQSCSGYWPFLFSFTGEPPPPKAPCEPSPCGANAVCRISGEAPSCSCLPSYSGSPPYCRPECVTNSECSFDKACINNKCADPCLGACGQNAECRVISHSPQCRCQPGYEGNSFDQCLPITGLIKSCTSIS